MITTWDVRTAAKNLGIDIVPFFEDPTYARGVSKDRRMAVRPGEPHPVFISLHEMAHIVLGHTAELERYGYLTDNENARHEVEAHTVALALAQDLKLVNGIEYDEKGEKHYLHHFGDHDDYAIAAYLKSVRAKLAEASLAIYYAGLTHSAAERLAGAAA